MNKDPLKLIIKRISVLDNDRKIDALNIIKQELHKISPFKDEPVDCVVWVNRNDVVANEYNPNTVAPPEMELLKLSILSDGFTQPIVSMIDEHNKREVIDGFHRKRVGTECEEVKEKIYGYLPVVTIRSDREAINDRIASTIRHNRARGKHQVEGMSEIVVDLKKRNWSNAKIGRELGMDKDEVLRLAQISGLTELFKDKNFSQAWEDEETLILDSTIQEQIDEPTGKEI